MKEVFTAFVCDMYGLEQDIKKLIDDIFDNLKINESSFDLYKNSKSLIDQAEKKVLRKKNILIV